MRAPWFVASASDVTPSIVDVVGVMVAAPAPVFCTSIQQPEGSEAGNGNVTAIAPGLEYDTSLPQSFGLIVSLVDVTLRVKIRVCPPERRVTVNDWALALMCKSGIEDTDANKSTAVGFIL